jgi:hypothetical protein
MGNICFGTCWLPQLKKLFNSCIYAVTMGTCARLGPLVSYNLVRNITRRTYRRYFSLTSVYEVEGRTSRQIHGEPVVRCVPDHAGSLPLTIRVISFLIKVGMRF